MIKLSAVNPTRSIERIVIVENSFRPGVGLLIAKLFRVKNDSAFSTLIIDSDELDSSIPNYDPDVVVLDVDSLRHFNALNVAVEIRALRPDQVIVFSSDHPNPVLVKEGMVAALLSRAYWLNQPSQNPSLVLPEIIRAFSGNKQLNPEVLEAAVTETTHLGRLSPQQHRVMRLMSLGASNAKIAQDCRITAKAVERTIAAASKLLEVDASSPDINHRVKAANKYRQSMLFTDFDEVE